MKIIVGYNGLVGQTIMQSREFDHHFNSSNINTFDDIVNDGDDIFLSCLPSSKRIINKNILDDFNNIINIINIISKKKYSSVTLISTIDVYTDSPIGSKEDYKPNISKLEYGSNRYLFELMVREFVKCDDLKIFRLGALFNNLLKKNILFDLINEKDFDININSRYQWYNLDNLHSDIENLSKKYPNEILFNLFTEPIETSDLVSLFPKNKSKIIFGDKIDYNYMTKFNSNGYLHTKKELMLEINNLISNKIKMKYDKI